MAWKKNSNQKKTKKTRHAGNETKRVIIGTDGDLHHQAPSVILSCADETQFLLSLSLSVCTMPPPRPSLRFVKTFLLTLQPPNPYATTSLATTIRL
jgi:hypothetical protein